MFSCLYLSEPFAKLTKFYVSDFGFLGVQWDFCEKCIICTPKASYNWNNTTQHHTYLFWCLDPVPTTFVWKQYSVTLDLIFDPFSDVIYQKYRRTNIKYVVAFTSHFVSLRYRRGIKKRNKTDTAFSVKSEKFEFFSKINWSQINVHFALGLVFLEKNDF